jgi:glycerate kinase
MQVLVAPDSFTGSMTAAQAASAIADGWRTRAAEDVLVPIPLSDGGPGFVAALHTALGGELLAVPTTGPWGAPTPGSVLLVPGDGGPTAYVEVAQAAGETGAARGAATAASSHGVARLLQAAAEARPVRIVVGLGGTLVTDGGAGMLAGLGATATAADGAPADRRLLSGGGGLAGIDAVDLAAARQRFAGIDLVIASDVDNPLLGARGAAHGFGPQKGLGPADADAVEAGLRDLANACGWLPDGRSPALALGAGAAGGLGFALLHLGGRLVGGIDVVMDAVGFAEQVAAADLVVTGEGRLDWQSLRGKVITGVCREAMAHGRPVLVLAGSVAVGRREWMAIGVSGAYGIVEEAASAAAVADAVAQGPQRLAELAARAARTWSH